MHGGIGFLYKIIQCFFRVLDPVLHNGLGVLVLVDQPLHLIIFIAVFLQPVEEIRGILSPHGVFDTLHLDEVGGRSRINAAHIAGQIRHPLHEPLHVSGIAVASGDKPPPAG